MQKQQPHSTFRPSEPSGLSAKKRIMVDDNPREHNVAPSTQHPLDQQLISRASAGDLPWAAKLLELGANPLAQSSQALREAAENGHAECVRLLIPVSDPKARGSYALQLAARNGHVGCVELLIPASSPQADDSRALVWAAKKGHAQCVELLIPVSDPQAERSIAFRGAAQYGHAECVKLLLPYSDPKAMHGQALLLAVENGHIDCVIVLSELAPDSIQTPAISPLARSAEANGHLDLAAFLRSIHERREIRSALPAPTKNAPLRATRI